MEISRYQMFSNETDFTCTVFHWSQDNVSPLTPVSEFMYFHDAYPPFIYLQHPRGWMSTLMPKLLKPMCLSLFFFLIYLLLKYACVLSCFSCVWLSVTLWTEAHHVPLSMEFSRQEYWSRLPCPPPGDLPGPGIEPTSLMSPALAGGFFYQ